jgi:hypothetical protein
MAPRIYYCAQNDVVRAFTYDQTRGRLTGPVDQGSTVIGDGAIPVVSSNGDQVGTGILWVLSRADPRQLTAYDLNPSLPLESALLAKLDVDSWPGSLGPPPTVVNGRVYAACDGRVAVLGLVPRPRTMSVQVEPAASTGSQLAVKVTVTDQQDGTPLAGATVSVMRSGRVSASGVTGPQGSVLLTYPGCVEVIVIPLPKPHSVTVRVPCTGVVTRPGYDEVGFSTPRPAP